MELSQIIAVYVDEAQPGDITFSIDSEGIANAVLNSPEMQQVRTALRSLASISEPLPGTACMLELHGLPQSVVDWVMA